MPRSATTRAVLRGLVPLAVVALGASACATSHLDDFNDTTMGGAAPSSVPSTVAPLGAVDRAGTAGAPISQVLALHDGRIAVQLEDPPRMLLGTVETGRFVEESSADLPAGSLPAELADEDGVLVPGPAGLGRVDGAGRYSPVGETGPVTAAAELADGRILTGSNDGTVSVRDAGGAETKKLESLASVDELVSAGGVGLAVSRADTTVATVDPDGREIGPILRPGKAVATATPAADGWTAVADTTGDALVILNVDPLRTQQMFPVGDAPWAVASVPGTSVLWVALTGENRIAAVDISGGKGREVASVPSVGSPTSVAVTSDGTLVVGSADGGGLQIVPPDEQKLPAH